MANNTGSVRLFGATIVVSKFCTIDDDHVDTSSKFSVVNDRVDTSLRLSTAVSTSSDPPVYNPTPLRSFPLGIIPEADFWPGGYDHSAAGIFAPDHVDTTLSLSHASPRTSDEERGKSRKRKQDVGEEKKRRSVKRNRGRGADDQNSCSIPSREDIQELLQMIESRNGTRPILLYQKKLKASDVSRHYNRLLVTRRDKLMEFLAEEEVTALNHSRLGLEISALDPRGKLYVLGIRIWRSLRMMVVYSDWNRLAIENNAQKGDWIQVWGYRENQKLHLAINFRKCEA